MKIGKKHNFTSRVYNAVGVEGHARHAYLTARSYAEHNSAFERSIIHFPIVQDILANRCADTAAALSRTVHIIELIDEFQGHIRERRELLRRMEIELEEILSWHTMTM